MQKIVLDPKNSINWHAPSAAYVLYADPSAYLVYQAIVLDGKLPISVAELALIRTSSSIKTFNEKITSAFVAETIYTGTVITAFKSAFHRATSLSSQEWAKLDHNFIRWSALKSYGSFRNSQPTSRPELPLPPYNFINPEFKEDLRQQIFGEIYSSLQQQISNLENLPSNIAESKSGTVKGILDLHLSNNPNLDVQDGRVYPIGLEALIPHNHQKMGLFMKPEIKRNHNMVQVIAVSPDIETRIEILSTFGIEITDSLKSAITKLYQ